MSYDLYFFPHAPQVEVPATSLLDYFKGRKYYEVSERQAWYSNELTGVYFSFGYGDTQKAEDDPEETDESANAVASFNLNYYRPHIFGLEAEPEIASFIAAFNMRIFDPQTDGMNEGPYSREGFLKGWNHGNEFGYRSILSREGAKESPHTLAYSRLQSIWVWNYGVNAFQQELGDNIFVPRVMHIQLQGRVQTMAVWPDAIPIALPEVDYLFMLRKEHAQRKWFKRSEDNVFIPFQTARVLLDAYRSDKKGLQYWLLDFQQAPPSIVHWLQSHPSFVGKLDGLAVDSILDEELVAKARGT